MFRLLLVAFALTSATVILHGLGTLAAVAHLSRVWRQHDTARRWLMAEIQLALAVGVLLLLHFAEAGVWAGAYRLLGLLPDLETAVYFSITSYTTVGYGDVVLPVSWRLLGPIEAAVGILMLGWSTAILVAAIQRVYGDRLRWHPEPTDTDQE
ncbi:MAG: two pore domain potassium channel family protein [Planctomycetia bacterium]|nr:two pore domain potassium channel family protein [Planctomycetia bacterium]